MNFTRAKMSESNMSCLQGRINVTYDMLYDTFGVPETGGDKNDVEWVIKFEDGTIATIYDYKTGYNYNGSSGTPAQLNRDWHVGGFSNNAVELVKSALTMHFINSL
jgi:hypothetical protein